MQRAVSVETVVKIVESIFMTMMDLEVSAVDAPWRPAGDRLTSSVTLEGEWNGAVSIECDRNQACQFAGMFLCSSPPEEVNESVRDMLGELTNMIGGNIKSVMTKKVRLSMPRVFERGNDESGDPEHEIAFRYSGGDFWVTVAGDDAADAGLERA